MYKHSVPITPQTPLKDLTQPQYIDASEKMAPVYDEVDEMYVQDEFGHSMMNKPAPDNKEWAHFDSNYFRPDISGLYCDQIKHIGMNPFPETCNNRSLNRAMNDVVSQGKYNNLAAAERKTWSTPRQMYREPQLHPHSQFKRIYGEIYPRTNGRLGDAIFTGYPLYDNAI